METKQLNKCQFGEKQLDGDVEFIIMKYVFHSIPII